MRPLRRPPISESDYTTTDRGHSSLCFIWNGKLSSAGYGKVNVDGKQIYAHRAMYEQEVGPIPDGKELDHLCRQTDCVNPSHLDPVTHAVNLRRGKGTKISDEQAQAIREDPRLLVRIAEDYGLHPSYVGRLKAGKKRVAL